MPSNSTIQIPASLKARLNATKIHRRETYADVVERLLEDVEELGPQTKRAVAKSRRHVRAGGYKTLQQVKREMRL